MIGGYANAWMNKHMSLCGLKNAHAHYIYSSLEQSEHALKVGAGLLLASKELARQGCGEVCMQKSELEVHQTLQLFL